MYRISYCMTTKHILRYPHHQTKRYCVQQCAVAVVPGKRRWCTKTLFIVAFEPKALSVYRNRVLNALLKLLCGSPNRANGMAKKKRTKKKTKKGKNKKVNSVKAILSALLPRSTALLGDPYCVLMRARTECCCIQAFRRVLGALMRRFC